MRVPSGKDYTAEDIELIKEFHQCRIISWHENPVTFKDGTKSHVYTSFRQELTDNPALELRLGKRIAETIAANTLATDKQPCLIGIPSGGTAIAQAAAMASESHRILAFTSIGSVQICHRVMKEQQKDYGLHQGWVNGEPNIQRHTYWFVDNVVTGGQTKLDARERLYQDDYPSEDMPSLIVVDLQRGGLQKMDMWGFPRITVMYNILDICSALTQLGIWGSERLAALKEEITMGTA